MGNAPPVCCKCEDAEGGELPVLEITAATKDPPKEPEPAEPWSAITISPPPDIVPPVALSGAVSPSATASPRGSPRGSPRIGPLASTLAQRRHSTSQGSAPSLTGSAESNSGRLALPGAALPKSTSSFSRGTTYTSDQSGASRMSKLQRLNSLGHLEVDQDLLCGLTIRKSLRSCGQSWMTMPKDMNHEQLVALHSKAEAMDNFDFFLSHTWSTHGKWKVLSLLMQTGWPCAVVCGSLAVTLTTLLCLNDVLPMPWSFWSELQEGTGSWERYPLGCWISSSSFIGFLLGFLISPYLPCLNGRPGKCFIDMVSIDQSDAAKIEEGIYGIGGFLKVSKELQVLWSPPYLSRLWCVFELAAYRKANPEGKITLSPLYVEQLLLMMIFGLYAVLGLYWVMVAMQISGVVSLALYALAMIPSSLPLHLMRRNFAESKHKLLADLKNFDIKQVHCMDDFDRSFIHSAIIKWYGSREAFTDFVRGPLRDELLKDSKTSVNHISFGYAILIGFLSCSMSWEYFISFVKGGASGEFLISYLFGTIVAFSLIWTMLALRLALYLCDRLANRQSTLCLDYLKTFLCWLLVSVWQLSGAIIQETVTRNSLGMSFAWLGITMALAALSWRMSR